MKRKILITFSVVLIFLIALKISIAAVGVGISPTKVIFQVEGGKNQVLELLVYNTGDSPMEVKLTADDNLASITNIRPSSMIITPEPIPHEFPIKNGRKFVVEFTPPVTRKDIVYTGSISAIGANAGNSQFGGSVGVATQVELRVTKTRSQLDFITAQQIIIGSLIVLIIIIIILIKKAGFRLKLEKKPNIKPKKK